MHNLVPGLSLQLYHLMVVSVSHFTHVVPAAAATSNRFFAYQELHILFPDSSLQSNHLMVVCVPQSTHVVPAAFRWPAPAKNMEL
jgi:hypothetical protein